MKKRTERLLIALAGANFGASLCTASNGGVPERELELISLAVKQIKQLNPIGAKLLVCVVDTDADTSSVINDVMTCKQLQSLPVKQRMPIIRTALLDMTNKLTCEPCFGRGEIKAGQDCATKHQTCPVCHGTGRHKVTSQELANLVRQFQSALKKFNVTPVAISERVIYSAYVDLMDYMRSAYLIALREVERVIDDYDESKGS